MKMKMKNDLSPSALSAAESIAELIIELENIALTDDGCMHTDEGSGLSCWHCRQDMYKQAALSVLAGLL